MSPLSTNRVRLFLTPTQIVVDSGETLDYRSGERPVTLRNGEESLAESLTHALSIVFEQRKARHIEWVLSNHLVRYVIAPWSADVKRGGEDRTWLAIAFEEQCGESLDDCELLASPNGYGRNRLAAAVSGGLLSDIREATARAGKTVQAIEPWLVKQINRWRSLLHNERCYFAVAEQGRLVVTFVDNGNYVLVRSHRCAENWMEQLAQWTKRESVISGLNATPHTYLCTSHDMRANSHDFDTSRITLLGNELKEHTVNASRFFRWWPRREISIEHGTSTGQRDAQS